LHTTMLLFVSSLRPPTRTTLFPYTTLFRSLEQPGCRALTGDTGIGRQGARDDARLTVELGGHAMHRSDERAAPAANDTGTQPARSEEHTSELQSRGHLVCRLLLEKKKLNKQ